MNDGAAQINKNIRHELYVKSGVVKPMPVELDKWNCQLTRILD